MNRLVPGVLIVLSVTLITVGCSRGSNNYSSGPDHTAGMTTTRTWSGTSDGYAKGDSVKAGDTTHLVWPRAFHLKITDSLMTVIRINDFTARLLDAQLAYNLAGSVTPVVLFDGKLTGSSQTSKLTYDATTKKMTFEYHEVNGYHAATGISYNTDIILHTTN